MPISRYHVRVLQLPEFVGEYLCAAAIAAPRLKVQDKPNGTAGRAGDGGVERPRGRGCIGRHARGSNRAVAAHRGL